MKLFAFVEGTLNITICYLYGTVLAEKHEFEKAEKYYLDELATWKAQLGSSHPQVYRELSFESVTKMH